MKTLYVNENHTCLAWQSFISKLTGTRVTINTIGTIATVLTRVADAFIDIWFDNRI